MAQIIKSDTGQVFKNSEGLVLRDNYDFGRALLSGKQAEVNFPNVFTGTRSVLLAFSGNNVNANNLIYYNGATQIGRVMTSGGNHFSYMELAPTYHVTVGGYAGTTTDRRVFGMSYWGAGHRAFSGSSATVAAQSVSDEANVALRNFNRIRIAQSNNQAELFLFDRVVEPKECYHYYNNGLGNELLNPFGLVLWLKFDKAEILPCYDYTTGTVSDKVGVRDFSGNNHHAYLVGLPAGTLQQQMDYANANYFTGIW